MKNSALLGHQVMQVKRNIWGKIGGAAHSLGNPADRGDCIPQLAGSVRGTKTLAAAIRGLLVVTGLPLSFLPSPVQPTFLGDRQLLVLKPIQIPPSHRAPPL